MRRISFLLAVTLLGCGGGSDGDAGSDAPADSAADVRDSSRPPIDTGPECPLSCTGAEVCCFDPDGAPRCVDLDNDELHCGDCNVDCSDGRGTFCARGRCVCGIVEIGCAGERGSYCCPPRDGVGAAYCANFDDDGSDCGECGLRCDVAQADRCSAGRCTCGDTRTGCIGTADDTCCPDVAGFASCIDTTTSVENCGGCGRRCIFGDVCRLGVCSRGEGTCPDGCGDAELCCDGMCCDSITCGRGECGADAGVAMDGGETDGGADGAADGGP